MGLILDTSEFISVERKNLSVLNLLTRFQATETLSVSVITLAELKHGVRRADTPKRTLDRQSFLNDVISAFIVLPVTASIAMRAGDLEAELELQGEGLPLPDLLIAATALEAGIPLVTANVRHFSRIPNLQIF